MTNEERLKKLEQLKELKALKEKQAAQPTGDFFDPNRYALENIPSLEDLKDPNSYKVKNLEDILLGMAGVSPAIATKPMAQGLVSGGKNLYKSAFKKIDQAIANYGKKPVSDVLFERGITGTSASVFDKASDLVDDLVKQQRQILEEVDKTVPSADLDNALQPLRDKIKEFQMSRDPVKMQAADALLEDLAQYEKVKFEGGAPGVRGFEEGQAMPISPSQMSAMKSSAQKLVPKTAYSQEIGRTNPAYQQGKKIIGKGLKEEVERAAGQASPELQQQLLGTNTDLSSLLSAGKALQTEAQKGLNKNFLTSVDPMVGALGHTSGMALPAMAAKKAADLSKTTWFRTNVGKGMYNLGQYGDQLVDPAAAYSLWYFLNTGKEPQDER